jgi:hypothetical protein
LDLLKLFFRGDPLVLYSLKFYVAHVSLIDLDDVTLYTSKEQSAYFCVTLMLQAWTDRDVK